MGLSTDFKSFRLATKREDVPGDSLLDLDNIEKGICH